MERLHVKDVLARLLSWSESVNEFEEDLKKLCIVLMGLTASGKSRFIQTDMLKYFPSFSGYSITNSDNNLQHAQYERAKELYSSLMDKIETREDYEQFKNNAFYYDNDDRRVEFPLTWDWWKAYKDKGSDFFYKSSRKDYWASFFSVRDIAAKADSKYFDDKIYSSANLLVIDTVAANSEKIIKRLKNTKNENFTNVIIYLEIDPKISVERDIYRGETKGRRVGASVIYDYAKGMDKALKAYKEEGQKDDGVVDRILHFKWVPTGSKPTEGYYQSIDDLRYGVLRKLRARKVGN